MTANRSVTQVPVSQLPVIADAGDQAARRFLEFFAATTQQENPAALFGFSPVATRASARRARRYRAAAYLRLRQRHDRDFEKRSVKATSPATRIEFYRLITSTPR